MSKQTYVLWKVKDTFKAKLHNDVVSVRWNPGREEQFLRMIAGWQAMDGMLKAFEGAGEDGDDEQEQSG